MPRPHHSEVCLVQSVRARRAEAAQALGRAFQTDPLFVYLIPKPEVRAVVMPPFFGVVAAYTQAYGVLDSAPGSAGAACWLGPVQTSPKVRQMLRLGRPPWRLWRALFLFGVRGMRQLMAISDYAEEQHRRAMPGDHWYLWAIGVDPDCQRQGMGGRLLQAGLDRADAERRACYLETNNVLNVSFYQKRGFKVINHGQAPGHEVTFWAMRREPRP